ncbi:hypothetical protein H0A71_06135 [Alcaligenaceae bacterium]|nr:hypothetical protein [Alcaligenaceae bacterium]
MGTQIIARGVFAESFATKYAPPVRRGLLAWHFLNEGLEKAARNYAPGGPDAQVIGSPTASSIKVAFKGDSDYIQTVIPEPLGELTMIMVGRSTDTMADDDHRPMFAGTYTGSAALGGGTSFGAGLYTPDATKITFIRAKAEPGGASPTSALGSITVDPTDWNLIIGTAYADTGVNKLYGITNGATKSGDPSSKVAWPSSNAMRIGSGYGGRYKGLCDMAFFALYNVRLTDEEIGLISADIRRYMASKGIVV